MLKKVFVLTLALIMGFIFGYFSLKFLGASLPNNMTTSEILDPLGLAKHQVIGFMPYWLTGNANKDYTQYINTLSYFSLTIDKDGSIVKLAKPGESDPGWLALNSGKMDGFFTQAKNKGVNLSLLVFSGNEENIYGLISDPINNANTLVSQVAPIMKQYGFTDLNLDIESTTEASEEARQNFTAFVTQVKKNINERKLGTVTVDASPIVLIKKYLVDLTKVGNIADKIVLMTYDFHYPGSFVTGPVGQNRGGGIEAEFDSEQAVKEALKIMPSQKIILGIPLYGYEWETLSDTPRTGTIPGTGIIASSRRVENFIENCASCSPQIDKYGEESYLIYKDQDTGTYHQIFYPDKNATSKKVELANEYRLGGVALWALGYDSGNILDPLTDYKNSTN